MSEIRLFTRKPFPGYFSIEKLFETVHRALPRDVNARVVRCPVFSKGAARMAVCLLHAWAHRGRVNHIVGDVHYLALAFPKRSLILTVHDLNRLYGLRGLRGRIFKWLYFDMPVRRAARVTAISEATAEQLRNLFPGERGKIEVIPNCLPSGFKPNAKPFNRARPLILQIGTSPNKNVERVVQAVCGIGCELCVVGELPPSELALLHRTGQFFQNFVGISEPEMVALYEACDLVVFASTAEGFGLPILEAQSVGRPVVTSDMEPMRSVAGGGACLVNPYDIESIRAGIRRVIEDGEFRAGLIKRGFENVTAYTAASVAERYADVYRSVLNARRSAVVTGHSRVCRPSGEQRT